jgi:hypothetical protein
MPTVMALLNMPSFTAKCEEPENYALGNKQRASTTGSRPGKINTHRTTTL